VLAAPAKRGGYRGNRYKSATTTVVREQKFSGKCDSLSGFLYDCADGKQSDRFDIVTKEIAEYVGREYPYGGDIHWTIQNLKLFKKKEPSELADAPSGVKSACGKGAWTNTKGGNKLKENCQMAHSLVIGQCMKYMRTKMEAVVGYNDTEDRPDLIGLSKTIKGLSFQFEGQQSKTRGLLLAHKRFHQLNQTRDMTDARFLEKFLMSVAARTVRRDHREEPRCCRGRDRRGRLHHIGHRGGNQASI
jgi:hypothetical protein